MDMKKVYEQLKEDGYLCLDGVETLLKDTYEDEVYLKVIMLDKTIIYFSRIKPTETLHLTFEDCIVFNYNNAEYAKEVMTTFNNVSHLLIY